MNKQKYILLGLLVIPWLTVPLLGREAIKRYLAASLFITFVTKLIYNIGRNRKWWKFYDKLEPLKKEDPLIYGPYFLSSFWVLKKTYGNFKLYIISNIILHAFFELIGLKFLKSFRIFTLNKLTKLEYFIYHFIRALALYAFQFLKEKFSGTRRNCTQ
jgi:hypothetical protein